MFLLGTQTDSASLNDVGSQCDIGLLQPAPSVLSDATSRSPGNSDYTWVPSQSQYQSQSFSYNSLSANPRNFHDSKFIIFYSSLLKLLSVTAHHVFLLTCNAQVKLMALFSP